MIVDERLIDEWVHIASFEDNLLSTLFWTVVGFELRHERVVIEPVKDHVFRLLLLIEGDTDADGLVRVVREWRFALQVS